MNHLTCSALLAAALAPSALADGEAHAAQHRVYRNWKFELPQETFTKLSGGFTVGGHLFAAEPRGAGLEVDLDGDGVLDRVIEGVENEDTGVRSAYVMLETQGADGDVVGGAVRLVNEGQGWHWASSSTMLAQVGGTKVQLIDQNNDGRYDQVGVDAIAVGTSKVACFLSEAMHLNGALVEILVSADGKRLELAPYEGETGVLDARSEFATDGKLLSAVVQSKDKRFSFDLARSGEGLRVPVGSYEIKSGKIGLGAHAVTVTQGDADYVDVDAGAATTLEWGGPVRAEFAYHRRGDELLISPAEVWYYGAAGEQYSTWYPVGKSPEFTVKEIGAGTEVAKALFPGSC